MDANDTVSQTIETVRPRWQDEAQGRGIQIELVKSLDATLTIQATRDELQDDVVNLLRAVSGTLADLSAIPGTFVSVTPYNEITISISADLRFGLTDEIERIVLDSSTKQEAVHTVITTFQ